MDTMSGLEMDFRRSVSAQLPGSSAGSPRCGRAVDWFNGVALLVLVSCVVPGMCTINNTADYSKHTISPHSNCSIVLTNAVGTLDLSNYLTNSNSNYSCRILVNIQGASYLRLFVFNTEALSVVFQHHTRVEKNISKHIMLQIRDKSMFPIELESNLLISLVQNWTKTFSRSPWRQMVLWYVATGPAIPEPLCGLGQEVFVQNGRIEVTKRTLGSRARVRCRDGYSPSLQGTHPICVPKDGALVWEWQGTCVRQCPDPTPIRHGSVRVTYHTHPNKNAHSTSRGEESSLLASAVYSCQRPYVLQGHGQSACSIDQHGTPSWQHTTAACILPACQHPISLEPKGGSIILPSVPSTGRETRVCRWTITPASMESIVDFTLLDLKLPPCPGSSLSFVSTSPFPPFPSVTLTNQSVPTRALSVTTSGTVVVTYQHPASCHMTGSGIFNIRYKVRTQHRIRREATPPGENMVTTSGNLRPVQSTPDPALTRGISSSIQSLTTTAQPPVDSSPDQSWKIAVGVVIPLLLIAVVVFLVYKIYRRKFPVRMILGREFSKFRNPDYSRPTSGLTLVRDDADRVFAGPFGDPVEHNPEFQISDFKIPYENKGFEADDEIDIENEEDQDDMEFRKKKSWLFRKDEEEARVYKTEGGDAVDGPATTSAEFSDDSDIEAMLQEQKLTPRIKRKNASNSVSSSSSTSSEPGDQGVSGDKETLKSSYTKEDVDNSHPHSNEDPTPEVPLIEKFGSLFEQPTVEEVRARMKARARSVSVEKSASTSRSRSGSVNVDPAMSARRMSHSDVLDVHKVDLVRFIHRQKITASVVEVKYLSEEDRAVCCSLSSVGSNNHLITDLDDDSFDRSGIEREDNLKDTRDEIKDNDDVITFTAGGEEETEGKEELKGMEERGEMNAKEDIGMEGVNVNSEEMEKEEVEAVDVANEKKENKKHEESSEEEIVRENTTGEEEEKSVVTERDAEDERAQNKILTSGVDEDKRGVGHAEGTAAVETKSFMDAMQTQVPRETMKRDNSESRLDKTDLVGSPNDDIDTLGPRTASSSSASLDSRSDFGDRFDTNERMESNIAVHSGFEDSANEMAGTDSYKVAIPVPVSSQSIQLEQMEKSLDLSIDPKTTEESKGNADSDGWHDGHDFQEECMGREDTSIERSEDFEMVEREDIAEEIVSTPSDVHPGEVGSNNGMATSLSEYELNSVMCAEDEHSSTDTHDKNTPAQVERLNEFDGDGSDNEKQEDVEEESQGLKDKTPPKYSEDDPDRSVETNKNLPCEQKHLSQDEDSDDSSILEDDLEEKEESPPIIDRAFYSDEESSSTRGNQDMDKGAPHSPSLDQSSSLLTANTDEAVLQSMSLDKGFPSHPSQGQIAHTSIGQDQITPSHLFQDKAVPSLSFQDQFVPSPTPQDQTIPLPTSLDHSDPSSQFLEPVTQISMSLEGTTQLPPSGNKLRLISSIQLSDVSSDSSDADEEKVQEALVSDKDAETVPGAPVRKIRFQAKDIVDDGSDVDDDSLSSHDGSTEAEEEESAAYQVEKLSSIVDTDFQTQTTTETSIDQADVKLDVNLTPDLRDRASSWASVSSRDRSSTGLSDRVDVYGEFTDDAIDQILTESCEVGHDVGAEGSVSSVTERIAVAVDADLKFEFNERTKIKLLDVNDSEDDDVDV